MCFPNEGVSRITKTKNPSPVIQVRVFIASLEQSPTLEGCSSHGRYPGFRIMLLTAPSHTGFPARNCAWINCAMGSAAFIPDYSGGSAAARPHSLYRNHTGKELIPFENTPIPQKVKHK
ncbi:MAG: hypothetical protein AMS17_14135 [Spirochaetes bacterium DG_61]|nr:MAG: hypothetical protein AMS17_14135 [Spirochaetes bacterium DG_61]